MENRFKYNIHDVKVSIHNSKETYDITGDVVSINTNKALSTFPGNFTVSVIPKKASLTDKGSTSKMPFTSSSIYQSFWMKTFKPNDLILISFSTGSNNDRLFTMAGLIDSIHRVRKIETHGKVVHTIDFVGRDAGKVLEQNDISLISNIQIDNEIVHGGSIKREALRKLIGLPGFAARAELIGKIVNSSVKNAVDQILSWYQGFFNKVTWDIDGHKYNMGQMIDWQTRSDYNENELIQGFEIGTAGGTLTALINQIAEKPFYEFFIDTHYKFPATAYLTVRPTPFSEIKQKTLWGFLNNIDSNFHYLEDSDIVMEDTRKSDSEVYTAFKITPTIAGTKPTPLNNIFRTIINKELFKRYGLRMLNITSRHAIIENKKFIYQLEGETGFPIAEQKRERALRWYFPNDQFQSGSLIINGTDRIRVGEYILRVIPDDEPLVYYVENVKQTWAFGQKWLTTLGVTRGLPISAFYKYFPRAFLREDGRELARPQVWDRGSQILNEGVIV